MLLVLLALAVVAVVVQTSEICVFLLGVGRRSPHGCLALIAVSDAPCISGPASAMELPAPSTRTSCRARREEVSRILASCIPERGDATSGCFLLRCKSRSSFAVMCKPLSGSSCFFGAESPCASFRTGGWPVFLAAARKLCNVDCASAPHSAIDLRPFKVVSASAPTSAVDRNKQSAK